MGLCIGGAHARTRAAADAGSAIGESHDLAFDVVVIIVEVEQIAAFVQAVQRHDAAAADLETAAAADAEGWID